MPGIATHYTFGLELYREFHDVIGEENVEREAFLLGNQGPDPFFAFTVVLPDRFSQKKLGSLMHTQKTTELLNAVHERMISDDAANDVLKAYALGFLGHFILDSTVHPLVYAQQQAISAAMIEGLAGDEMANVIHSCIETELDEYVLSSRLIGTVSSILPYKMMLRCPESSLLGISAGIADSVGKPYDIHVHRLLFHDAVHLFRLAQLVLNSGSCGMRRHIDYLESLRMASAHVKSLSHIDSWRDFTVFANDDHIPWPDAVGGGGCVSKSFDELFEDAFARMRTAIPVFARSELSKEDLLELSRECNFHGTPIPTIE